MLAAQGAQHSCQPCCCRAVQFSQQATADNPVMVGVAGISLISVRHMLRTKDKRLHNPALHLEVQAPQGT